MFEINIMPMTGLEPRTSSFESDRSTNWASTTAPTSANLHLFLQNQHRKTLPTLQSVKKEQSPASFSVFFKQKLYFFQQIYEENVQVYSYGACMWTHDIQMAILIP